MTIYAALTHHRKRRGLSQRALAKAAGLRRERYRLIELGERSPTVAELEALAGALGVEMVIAFRVTP